jgi:hypothetical protein
MPANKIQSSDSMNLIFWLILVGFPIPSQLKNKHCYRLCTRILNNKNFNLIIDIITQSKFT